MILIFHNKTHFEYTIRKIVKLVYVCSYLERFLLMRLNKKIFHLNSRPYQNEFYIVFLFKFGQILGFKYWMVTQIFRQFFNRCYIVKNETINENEHENKDTFSTMSADMAKHFSQQSAIHIRIMFFVIVWLLKFTHRTKQRTENIFKVN